MLGLFYYEHPQNVGNRYSDHIKISRNYLNSHCPLDLFEDNPI